MSSLSKYVMKRNICNCKIITGLQFRLMNNSDKYIGNTSNFKTFDS